MKKYILEYTDYDAIVALLGHSIPYTNYEHVTTVVVDLYQEEYLAITNAGYTIFENIILTPDSLCAVPEIQPNIGTPPPFLTYANIFNSHLAGFTGAGVSVALLDTGCNDVHAATVPTLIRQDYTGLGADGDLFTHGSRGCLIVGQILDFYTPFATVNYGIARGCQLYSMRCFDGGTASYIAAINYCIANGIDIMNFAISSLSGLTTAINAAIAAGIIVVSASGNNTATQIQPPSTITGVICVNAVLGTTGVVGGSHLTSNGHTQVTITNYNNGHYQTYMGGTSQASMMVSAILAIYKQKYPTLNQQKATNLLKRKALQMDGYTYNVTSTSRGVLENYVTGAGFISPIN